MPQGPGFNASLAENRNYSQDMNLIMGKQATHCHLHSSISDANLRYHKGTFVRLPVFSSDTVSVG